MSENTQDKELIKEVTQSEYKYGFVSDIEADEIPVGLTEETIRLISKKKGEPEWLLEFRLNAFEKWKNMEQPNWGHLDIPPIDYQSIYTTRHLSRRKNSTRSTKSTPKSRILSTGSVFRSTNRNDFRALLSMLSWIVFR